MSERERTPGGAIGSGEPRTPTIGSAGERTTAATASGSEPEPPTQTTAPRGRSLGITDHIGNPNPYAVYGYEAMDLILDTCDRLGPDCGDRQKLIDALYDTKGRESVLGTYDIDENGDTTLTDYGVYRVKDGELVFDETIKAAQ